MYTDLARVDHAMINKLLVIILIKFTLVDANILVEFEVNLHV